MKLSTFIFSTAIVLASTTSASVSDKECLCTEVCWTYNIGNHEGCTAQCKESARPTPAEAGQCVTCIDQCANKYLDKNPNMVVYTECRRGCFGKYFPQFMKGVSVKARAITNAPVKVALPGVPTYMRETMKGQIYPVEHEVCEMSCNAQGAGSILPKSPTIGSCMKHCIEYPTDRDQELQMSLDCGSKCDTLGVDTDESMKGCLTTCVSDTAPNRSIQKSLDNLQKALEDINSIDAVSSNADAEDDASAEEEPIAIGTYKGNYNDTNISKAAVENGITSSPTSKSTSSATSSHSATTEGIIAEGIAEIIDNIREGASVNDEQGGAMNIAYMKSTWFWTQIAGTLVIAMVVGVHMI